MPKRGKPKRNVVVIEGEGIPCPRCQRPTQIRQYREVTARERSRGYYRRWYYCTNSECSTKGVLFEGAP